MAYIMDYYRVLQVHHDAAPEVIEAAYRRLSKLNHPDVSKNSASAERMKQINLAFEVLGNVERRQRYHKEWAALVSGAKVLRRTMETQKTAHDPCYQVLDGYFHDLQQERWTSAYDRLTRADQQRISLKDFVQWKQEVARVFQLGSYALQLFRRHQECSVADTPYPEVREYSVYTCDMQLMTGRVNEETIPKYVALDQDQWRICLGYRDVRPFILKLRYMAQQAKHMNPDQALADALLKMDGLTGQLSRNGFMAELEREALRSQRYKNPFTVGIVHVLPAEGVTGLHQEGYRDLCIKHAMDLMSQVFRKTDILGRWSESSLAVLMTETDEAGGAKALAKLEQSLSHVEEPYYRVAAGCSQYYNHSVEETLRMAESNALLHRSQQECGKASIVIAGRAI